MSGLTLNPTSANDPTSGITSAPQRLRDNVGKLKVSESQNLFEADFEYGLQAMRWENFVAGSGSVVQVSNTGGVLMSVSTLVGDMAIRQTRPYQRYQPGKTMYMSSGFVFGSAFTNQRQRVGFFDDGNGVFWEQSDPTTANPFGMGFVYRSDSTGAPTDTRIDYTQWSDPYNIKSSINFNLIQMIWVEYAWYGAGLLRWGVMLNGEPYPLHQIGIGNKASQTGPWSRTGNLPIRYELRNVGATAAGSMYHYGVSVIAEGRIDTQRGFTYGYTTPINRVAPGASATRFPLLSIRYRAMGTLEYGVDAAYSGANGTLPSGGATIASVVQSSTATTVNLTGTPLVAGAWVGKYLFARASTAAVTSVTASAGSAVLNTTANPNYMNLGRWITVSGATGNTTVNGTFQVTAVTNGTITITGSSITSGAVTGTVVYTTGQGGMGRITANTTSSLTVVDNVLSGGGVTFPMVVPPVAGGNYILGLIDRGQILPQLLSIYSSSFSGVSTVELITSTSTSPVNLTGANWTTLYAAGSLNSFTEKDTSATGTATGGEVVYATPLPSGSMQNFDLSQFFPLYNNVSGNQPDILTVAITTGSGFAGTVSAALVGQEAMS